MSSDRLAHKPLDLPRLLCSQCSRIELLTAMNAVRHAHGWPRCCGHVMACTAGADSSSSVETVLDLPLGE